MHELSMAQAIVDTVLDAAQKNEAHDVLEITIEIGQLTMLNPEQLKFLLGVITEGTLLEGSEIIIEEIPVEIECQACDFKGQANTEGSDHYLTIVLCQECGGGNVEVTRGRECNVKNIRIEKVDEDA